MPSPARNNTPVDKDGDEHARLSESESPTNGGGLLPRSLFSHLGTREAVDVMPARVRALILTQEERSERLIGWVQLSIAVTFAILFLLAPRPADAPMTMYEPVPIALTAYTLFTLGRLILSYNGFLPGWLLVLSILLDMVLLIGLIWSFHIQYGQPAAFSLKVPTFIYLFVFIALRALRFDPRFVLTAGLAAAAAWGGLFVYVEQVSPPGSVTRNFIEYVTSVQILRGAEFDKIFTILLVTAILTFAIVRARRMFVLAIREGAASKDMRRFFSAGVADTITSADTSLRAGEAVEREAAIMMLDIRGFTGFSAGVEPREVVEMLTSYHERIVPIINHHGGVIDKFLGDGVMVTFGAVVPSETASAQSLAALEEILEESARWSAETTARGGGEALCVNGAVVGGTVVFATLGNRDRLEYTVIGEAVNLAAKLEKQNKIEETIALVPEATLELAHRQGYEPARRLVPLPGRHVQGVEEALDLHAFVSATQTQTP